MKENLTAVNKPQKQNLYDIKCSHIPLHAISSLNTMIEEGNIWVAGVYSTTMPEKPNASRNYPRSAIQQILFPNQ